MLYSPKTLLKYPAGRLFWNVESCSAEPTSQEVAAEQSHVQWQRWRLFFFFIFREKEKKKLKHWLGNALFLEILFRAVNPLNLVWWNGSRQWSATIKLWRVHNCPKVWMIHLTNSNLDSSALVWMVVHCVLVFRSYIQLVICSHYRWLSERSLEVT